MPSPRPLSAGRRGRVFCTSVNIIKPAGRPETEELSGNRGNWVLLFVAAFFVYVNLFVSITVFPRYAVEIGCTPLQSGLQNTFFFVTAVILRFYCGPYADRKGRTLPLLVGAFVFATTPLLLLYREGATMLILSRVYQGIGLAAFLQSGSSLVADMAPPQKRGAYLGAYRLLIVLAVLGGPPAALALIEKYGFRVFFGACALVGLFSLLLLIPLKTPHCLATWLFIFLKQAAWPAPVLTFYISAWPALRPI